ncbi:MAG TPA: glycosyl hydrolase family 25 [Cryomorphaceae bacterium]|nr:glycosyl hydrolase family 25 [Owenweeksia sp.]HAD97528.1 glycosyl hydrolase family 25 [Cryomorphaceae bacterium]HBF19014.1 glycosyl hydrolase family 25 [Cryomorphaceae bacterium]
MKIKYLSLAIIGLMLACNNPSSTDNSKKEDTTTANQEKAVTPPPAPTKTGPVLGIDVSHFQGDINWQEIKAARLDFAYDKATQGEDYKDPDYLHNREGAHAVGLIHGGYHFYVAGDNPDKQAANFLSAVTYEEGDMPPVLDLEQGGMKPGINTKTYQQNVLKWLQTVESKLNVRPVVYTNHPFGNQYLDHPDFAKYDLWIAEYEVDTPQIPNAWKNEGWLIWQRTERGKVEGAVGNVDHDLYSPKANFHKADME